MALIVCDKCGKKYSDTLNSCIHCGHRRNTAQASDDTAPAVESTVSAPIAEPLEEKKTLYYDLDFDYQKQLDDEFTMQGGWVLQFEQKRRACMKFWKAFFILPIIGVVSFVAMFFGAAFIANVTLLNVAMIWSAALIVLGLIGLIVSTVLFFVICRGKDSRKWLQLEAEWLKKEKDIIMEME